jgi:L-ascorbate metabolism protein UlaG (beta-lactamase superfamily)
MLKAQPIKVFSYGKMQRGFAYIINDMPRYASIQVTWIGHSTFLMQVAVLNLLTDSILSERASPVSFAGPRRYAPGTPSLVQLGPGDPPGESLFLSRHR